MKNPFSARSTDKRFEPQHRNPEIAAHRERALEQRFRQRSAHRNFVGAFARKTYARNPRRLAGEAAKRQRHMRQRGVGKVDAEVEPLEEFSRCRAGESERRPVGGRIVDVEPGGIELVLPPILQARMDACDVRSRARHDEARVVEPRDHPVVKHDAGLLQHEHVTEPSRLQRRRRHVDLEVEEARRVRTDDLDLAERRSIENSDVFTRSVDFPFDGGVLGADFAVEGGAQPAAVVVEDGAERAVARLERQAAQRVHELAGA